MDNMNIDLHIQRLILDGIEMPSHQRPQLHAAVETELARLLADGGLQPSLTVGGARAFVPRSNFQMTDNGNPDQLGQQIARSVYDGIGR